MIHPRSSIRPAMSGRGRTCLTLLVCSLMSACSASLPVFQDAGVFTRSADDQAVRTRDDGRVLDGRARGRYDHDLQLASQDADAADVQITAYQRDQSPPRSVTKTESRPELGMANRWRPATRSNDLDGDGVVDSLDECPDTATHVTVDRLGCGLFDAVLDEVVFTPGSRWLSDPARNRLDQLAETLLAFPESRVQVRAHTDSSGSASLNQRLSAERAESVVQYLLSRGVHVQQLQAVGMGESQPLASNSSATGQLRNRRVDIVTLPDQDAGELPELTPPGGVRAVTLLASATPQDYKSVPESEQPTARRPERTAEPAFQAALPLAVRERSKPPVMPLPQPGFAPGVRISGVVKGLGFKSGSADIQADSHVVLDGIARTLLDNPQVRIVVMAHTDDSGEADRNLQLSRQRAQAVVSYLAEQGVAGERLAAEGYGEMLPLVQNLTDEDRATNRRVEIRIQRDQGQSES